MRRSLRGRGKQTTVGNIQVVVHNVNGYRTTRWQQMVDIAATQSSAPHTVYCLQETKLHKIQCPPRHHLVHQVREGKSGGGIATIIPDSIPLISSSKGEYHVYSQLAL